MVDHLETEKGETPNEMLVRLVHGQLEQELAFESPQQSRHRRMVSEPLRGQDESFLDLDGVIDEI